VGIDSPDMASIVECSTCTQAWEVPTPVLATRNVWIQLPTHDAISEVGVSTGLPCRGVWRSGIAMGSRESWEERWAARHPSEPRPQLLEGDSVKLMRV
jgi:hypothetical protein